MRLIWLPIFSRKVAYFYPPLPYLVSYIYFRLHVYYTYCKNCKFLLIIVEKIRIRIREVILNLDPNPQRICRFFRRIAIPDNLIKISFFHLTMTILDQFRLFPRTINFLLYFSLFLFCSSILLLRLFIFLQVLKRKLNITGKDLDK